MDEAVVAAFLLKLADLCKGRVKVHHGRIFDYLGMDLDYGLSPGILDVFMLKYLTKVIREWPEELRGSKINPHSNRFSLNLHVARVLKFLFYTLNTMLRTKYYDSICPYQ